MGRDVKYYQLITNDDEINNITNKVYDLACHNVSEDSVVNSCDFGFYLKVLKSRNMISAEQEIKYLEFARSEVRKIEINLV